MALGAPGPVAEAFAADLASSGTGTGEIPLRPLGKTGVKVSAMCFGGAHWGRNPDDGEAIRLLHEAIDAGMTFLDNAWEYNGGRSEELMGKGLQGKRQQVFLMTKVCSHGRDKHVAMQQLEESLRRLKTDYLDLWQIHEVVYEDDPDRHFMPHGAVDALLEAKQQGKVRFIGFTGHKHPAIHLKMLSHDFPFDACQMPLNVFDGTYRSFEREVLPVLAQRGIGALGMESVTGNAEPIKQGVDGTWVAMDPDEAREKMSSGLHLSLSVFKQRHGRVTRPTGAAGVRSAGAALVRCARRRRAPRGGGGRG